MIFFAKSRARLVFFLCLLVALYFAYTAGVGAFRNHRLAEDRRVAEQQIAELEARKDHISAVRDYVASDQYVEQEARRQLGYIRPGEIPFVVISPPAPEEPNARGSWWERLFPR